MAGQGNTRRGQQKEESQGITEIALYHIAFAALGFLFGSGELYIGVYPFGIALVAAAAGKYLPAVAAGVMLAALAGGQYAVLVAVVALVAFRLLIALFTSGGKTLLSEYRELLSCVMPNSL